MRGGKNRPTGGRSIVATKNESSSEESDNYPKHLLPENNRKKSETCQFPHTRQGRKSVDKSGESNTSTISNENDVHNNINFVSVYALMSSAECESKDPKESTINNSTDMQDNSVIQTITKVDDPNKDRKDKLAQQAPGKRTICTSISWTSSICFVIAIGGIVVLVLHFTDCLIPKRNQGTNKDVPSSAIPTLQPSNTPTAEPSSVFSSESPTIVSSDVCPHNQIYLDCCAVYALMHNYISGICLGTLPVDTTEQLEFCFGNSDCKAILCSEYFSSQNVEGRSPHAISKSHRGTQLRHRIDLNQCLSK